MELEKFKYRQDLEPELVSVHFPQDAFIFPNMRNPQSEWEELAKESAKKLGVKIEIRKTKTGLAAAFLSAHDCNAVLAEMQPEWPKRLLAGLGYTISFLRRTETYQDGSSIEPEVLKILEAYGLDYNDIDSPDFNGPS